MSFFDFEEEKIEVDGYMKIKDGENRIRILSKSISYVEDWIDNKPVRYRDGDQPAEPHDENKPFKKIAAFIVYNYLEEKIQILQLRQASIRKKIRDLVNDSDWGEIYHYDLKIIRSGKELKTNYTVNPMPHKPVSQTIIEAFKAKPVFLPALFDNKDPFALGYPEYTQGVFSKEDAKINSPQTEKNSAQTNITFNQLIELETLIAGCQPGYRDNIMQRIADKFKYSELSQITPAIFSILKSEVLIKKKEYEEFRKKESEEYPF